MRSNVGACAVSFVVPAPIEPAIGAFASVYEKPWLETSSERIEGGVNRPSTHKLNEAELIQLIEAGAAPDYLCQGVPAIAEDFIPFQREVSIVAARSATGEIAAYPLIENVHKDHILHTSLAPAQGDPGYLR